jgi:CRISPR/Cas system-associated endoribonuclease Cas2
MVHVLP